MSNKTRQQIGKELRRITGTDTPESFPVMSGVVKSVDEDALTCVALLSTDNEEPTEDITLNAVADEANGFILFPAEGSTVWVAEVDGPGKLGVVKCSKVTKVKLGTDVEVEFNGGGNGGLPITPVLKEELDKVKSLLAHVVSIINGPSVTEPGSGAPSALQIALQAAIASDSIPSFENIENTKVKH